MSFLEQIKLNILKPIKTSLLFFGIILLFFAPCNLRNSLLVHFDMSTTKNLQSAKTVVNNNCNYNINQLNTKKSSVTQNVKLLFSFLAYFVNVDKGTSLKNNYTSKKVVLKTTIPLYILHKKIKAFIA